MQTDIYSTKCPSTGSIWHSNSTHSITVVIRARYDYYTRTCLCTLLHLVVDYVWCLRDMNIGGMLEVSQSMSSQPTPHQSTPKGRHWSNLRLTFNNMFCLAPRHTAATAASSTSATGRGGMHVYTHIALFGCWIWCLLWYRNCNGSCINMYIRLRCNH